MACGLPVIATRNAGRTTSIADGETGFLVPIRSPGEIAQNGVVLAKQGSPSLAWGCSARRARQFTWQS